MKEADQSSDQTELRRLYAEAVYKLGYICAAIGVAPDAPLQAIADKLRAQREEVAILRRHLSGKDQS